MSILAIRIKGRQKTVLMPRALNIVLNNKTGPLVLDSIDTAHILAFQKDSK